MATVPLVVVAAAIISGEPPRLLAAQRSHPPALAGRWELPGGKLEPGETETDGIRRECREELGVDVTVGEQVGPEVPTIDGRGVLRVHWATTTGTPQPLEHSALRWLGTDELWAVDWLETDAPVIETVRRSLLE